MTSLFGCQKPILTFSSTEQILGQRWIHLFIIKHFHINQFLYYELLTSVSTVRQTDKQTAADQWDRLTDTCRHTEDTKSARHKVIKAYFIFCSAF